jgi:hypothetical protein
MSPQVAHCDISRRGAILVAFGFEADISWLAEFDDSVENDPKATFGQMASEATRAPFLSRMVESAAL